MEKAKLISTPIAPHAVWIRTKEESKWRKKILMYDCFLFYIITSHPNIMFIVSSYACFQANLKESRLSAIKRITRYLTSTLIVGLWYPKGNVYALVGYSNSGFGVCKSD